MIYQAYNVLKNLFLQNIIKERNLTYQVNFNYSVFLFNALIILFLFPQ